MGFEYEHRYRDFDKAAIWKQLKELYPNIQKEVHLLRNTIYFKADNPELYIRIRNTGKQVYVTLKYHKGEYPEEYEVTVSDAESMHVMLTMLGCEIKYVVEKIRETWQLPHGEIAFDQHPGLPDFMEIEMDSHKRLMDLEKLLNVKPASFGAKLLYKHFYDIPEKRGDELSFHNAYKILGPMIQKNMSLFKETLQNQRRRIKRLPKHQ